MILGIFCLLLFGFAYYSLSAFIECDQKASQEELENIFKKHRRYRKLEELDGLKE